MFLVSFVNILQVSVVTLVIFGLAVFANQPTHRRFSVMLGLIALAAVFNLLEELNITREWYLVTPIFVFGFGPATYLTVQEFTGKQLDSKDWLHLLPMLFALPFTMYPQWVIAAGTLSRLIYALLSLNLLRLFHKELVKQRSDADELSLRWLFWLVIIFTLVIVMDHVRLNLQPYISHEINVFGQGVSTLAGLFFIGVLLYQLIVNASVWGLRNELYLDGASSGNSLENSSERKDSTDIGNLSGATTVSSVSNEDELAFYSSIFKQLEHSILANNWHCTPRLTLQKLSELSGIATRDISRAVNLENKSNFNDYINGLRVEEVCKQIQAQPKRTLLELAIDSGFTSKSTFNQAFKAVKGITPSSFKNQL